MASKEQAEQATRDDKGRFVPGCSGNLSGRPAGASSRLLSMARQWVESKGLPLMIQAAESGDMDALKSLVALAMPRQKPVAAPLEGLQSMPLPEVRRDMGATAAFLLEAVAAGRIALDDAERLLQFAKYSTDLKQLGKPFSVDDFTL